MPKKSSKNKPKVAASPAIEVVKTESSNVEKLSTPENVAPTTAQAFTVVGTSGTQVYGGYVYDNEKNPELKGKKRYETYGNIIANTPIVAAGVRRFLNLISKSGWKIEPADDTAEAKEYAEKLEAIIKDIKTPWHRVVRRAALFRFYGFGIQEWTAKFAKDGYIGLYDIAPRPQITIERWDVDTKGDVFGVWQRSPFDQKEIFLPRQKVIYLVDDSLNDSPEGLGLFRHVVSAAKRLARYEQLEGFGFETDLRGIPVGRAPFAMLDELVREGTITKDQKEQLLAPLRDFITNHIKNPQLGLMMDSLTYQTEDEKSAPSQTPQWDMKIIQGGPTGQKEVADAIVRLNHELARVMGVEGLLVGSNGRGSLALSRDKTHNFYLSVDSCLTEIKETYQKDLVDPLWQLNGWPEDLKPRFKTEAIQFRDVEQITNALKDLAQAGVPLMPTDDAVNEIRDLMGLSFSSKDFTLMEPLLGNDSGQDMDAEE